MLTNFERQKAEEILQSITNEIAGNPENEYYITMGDIRWLADKVIYLDDAIKVKHEQTD